MFFSQDWRERIRSENPDASFGLSCSLVLVVLTWAEGFWLLAGEVGKLLGAKWKELDDEEKKVGLNGFRLDFFSTRSNGIYMRITCSHDERLV